MSKKSLLNFKNIIFGDMSGNVTSAISNIQFLDNIGFQLHFTGTPTGTFSVEISANYAQDSQGVVTNVGNWVALNLSSSPAASGAAGDIYLDLNQLSAPWIRVKYTFASGTGTLNGWIAAKEV